MPTEGTRLQKVAWVMYDWANSGFGLIIVGPVFAPYFIKVLLPALPDGGNGLPAFGTVLPGSSVMGVLNSLSMALMAVAAPVLGAVADLKGWTKRLLVIFSLVGSLLACAMFALGPGRWVAGALLFVAANVCFGTSLAFANAFLPRLAAPGREGSLSGWGFAAGYVGGAVALILVLVMIKSGVDVRWGLAFAGLWWLAFSLPAYLLLPEIPPQRSPLDDPAGGSLLLAGFRRIGRTLGNIRQYRMLFLFLLAFLLYNDGVETVISMSPSFGTEYLRLANEDLIVIFLVVQFVAFAGALVSGYLADRLGNKTVILANLAVWIVAGALAIMTSPEPVHILGLTLSAYAQFVTLGVLIGLVLGGVQACSRALMALLSPDAIRNEAFGFFSISGKFASIFGPLIYAGLAFQFGPRYGIFSVFPFLLAGALVLLFVREPRAATGRADA